MNELNAFLDAEYGESAARIRAGFCDRPTSLRVNALKTDAEHVKGELTRLGFSYETVDWYRDALILRGASARELGKTELYARGEIYLQGLSSMLPPLYLEPAAGESILDMTAAPGGKTTELFALSGGKALITACERDRVRFGRLKFNLERQGATRVSALNQDAASLDGFLFDKILLDAPCSGSGTVSPSNPVRFTSDYLRKCVRAQEKLLRRALSLLKKGGRLVYSTCSVLREENDDLVRRVGKEEGASLLPVSAPSGVPVLDGEAGTVRVCPDALYEGFFVAVLTKPKARP